MTHIRIPESLEDFKDLVINLAHDAHLLYPSGEPTDKFKWALKYIHNFRLKETQVQQLIAIFPDSKIENNCRIRLAAHVWRTLYKEDVSILELLELEPVEEDSTPKDEVNDVHHELEEIIIHNVPDEPIEGLEIRTKEITLDTIPETVEVDDADATVEEDEDVAGETDEVDTVEPVKEDEPQPVKKRVYKKSTDPAKTTKRKGKVASQDV